jgi:hypothetical protein
VILRGFKSCVSEECDSKAVTGAFLWKSVKLKGSNRETGATGLSEAVGESSLKEVEYMLGLLALPLVESATRRIIVLSNESATNVSTVIKQMA